VLHLRLLFKRLLIAWLLFTVCRLLFYAFNYSFFNQYGFAEITTAFFAGLLFDTSAILYINSLFILLHIIPHSYRSNPGYQLFLKYLFIISNSLAIFLNVIDFAYFPFTNKRTGMELSGIGGDVVKLASEYVTGYWYLLLIWAAMIALMVVLYNKTYRAAGAKKIRWLPELMMFILLAACWVIGARGGLYLKPIQPYDAARFVRPELIPLTINTPFQLFSSIQQKGVQLREYYPREEVEKHYSPLHNYRPEEPFSRQNVVMIIVESLGKEYMGHYNGGEGYTPFLDSLCGHSLVFENAYANGKRSIEALPAMLSGIPSLMNEPYTGSYYQLNRVNSLGKLLNERGYDASFYHGGHNGTMGFDNYVSLSGSGTYYGMNEYPDKKDYDGSWGIFDEPYLQYYAGELDKKQQPFCSGIFTLSSHHPYRIPEKYEGILSPGKIPIHRTIRYTDLALKNFFARARSSTWYNNTVFVIIADHSAENITDKYQTAAGRYAIPLLIFKGDGSLKGKNYQTTQQIDIINTVLDLLHYPGPFFSFGKSATDTSAKNSWAVQYDNGLYQLIDHPFLLQFDGEKTVAFQAGNSALKIEDQERKRKEMEARIKAIIQQYSHYLVNNKMTIK
jgi:phosphoglycerol transferase MdoB-like AlkP superfamily enzyme